MQTIDTKSSSDFRGSIDLALGNTERALAAYPNLAENFGTMIEAQTLILWAGGWSDTIDELGHEWDGSLKPNLSGCRLEDSCPELPIEFEAWATYILCEAWEGLRSTGEGREALRAWDSSGSTDDELESIAGTLAMQWQGAGVCVSDDWNLPDGPYGYGPLEHADVSGEARCAMQNAFDRLIAETLSPFGGMVAIDDSEPEFEALGSCGCCEFRGGADMQAGTGLLTESLDPVAVSLCPSCVQLVANGVSPYDC